MPTLLHNLLTNSTNQRPDATALVHKKQSWSYQELTRLTSDQAHALVAAGLTKQHRVAIYLPKQLETVSSMLATSMAGGVFVPINPVLKASQTGHILNDCNVQILVTSKNRLNMLAEVLGQCPDLKTVILVDSENTQVETLKRIEILSWSLFLQGGHSETTLPSVIDTDIAAILYTSGSTGKPKGVVLSHLNMVAGAHSVAEYLGITNTDRLLAVLPFSFDYGLNQLTSSLLQGGCCVIMDYLLPRDVIKAVQKHQITGLAAVPPLWLQLAGLEWPEGISQHLRYMTNSGGKMPTPALNSLRESVPGCQFFLMYGLTEAFRSTYLPPNQIDRRPDSIGKAIPNAEINVVRPDGSLCNPGETGELVHRGSLVAMGYWNDPEKTAERFKPCPSPVAGLPLTEMAVWSGDSVTIDEEGYLYFVGREDEMIKTSGYRVSPSEVEEVIYASKLVPEVAVLGVPHPTLGQAIIAVIDAGEASNFNPDEITNFCKRELPNFMVPSEIKVIGPLPKNPNGKIDRSLLKKQYQDFYTSTASNV
ncbi:MAG: acyl-CoA ligase (AMP-forming), exosortase A system-associated [Pseudomonadales bacterium]|nr:acyl-CoA ligase (AMP-forming), exosortase A system-associated [Pseudomonadales bacterium]